MNTKFKQVFTCVLFVMFAGSLPVSSYILKTGNLDLRINAFESENPVKVMITDRTSNGFKILWLTEKKVFGAVKINETNDLISENFETNSHFLQINDLLPNTEYSFIIYSGTNEFPQTLKATTLASNETEDSNYVVFGQVFDKSGVKVQQTGLVTIGLNDGTTSSELLGTTVNETGGFQFNFKYLLIGTSYKL